MVNDRDKKKIEIKKNRDKKKREKKNGIKKTVKTKGMIKPFVNKQVRKGKISFGCSINLHILSTITHAKRLVAVFLSVNPLNNIGVAAAAAVAHFQILLEWSRIGDVRVTLLAELFFVLAFDTASAFASIEYL